MLVLFIPTVVLPTFMILLQCLMNFARLMKQITKLLRKLTDSLPIWKKLKLLLSS